MPVIRTEKNKDFTVISTHHLRDKNLSLKAIGLMTIILSLPESWDFSIAGLASITKDGLAAVRSALNELEANGYLRRERIRLANGKLERNEYTVYENPLPPAQSSLCDDFPNADTPTTENRILDDPDSDFSL